MVHVHGLYRAEAVESLQLVHSSGERVDCLEEGVVSQLERRMQWDWRGQSFAPHVGESLHGKGLS